VAYFGSTATQQGNMGPPSLSLRLAAGPSPLLHLSQSHSSPREVESRWAQRRRTTSGARRWAPWRGGGGQRAGGLAGFPNLSSAPPWPSPARTQPCRCTAPTCSPTHRVRVWPPLTASRRAPDRRSPSGGCSQKRTRARRG